MYFRALPDTFHQLLLSGYPEQAQADARRAGYSPDEVHQGFRREFFTALDERSWGHAWGIALYAFYTQRTNQDPRESALNLFLPEGLAMLVCEELLPTAQTLLDTKIDDRRLFWVLTGIETRDMGVRQEAVSQLRLILDARVTCLTTMGLTMLRLLPDLAYKTGKRPFGDFWKYMVDIGYTFGPTEITAPQIAALA